MSDEEALIRRSMTDVTNASKVAGVDPLYGACKVIVRYDYEIYKLKKEIEVLKQSKVVNSQFGNNNFGVFK